MSRVCPVTGKKPMYGKNVSHSRRHTCRRWNVNLQNTTVIIDGKKVKRRVSAAGLRTLRKNAKAQQDAACSESRRSQVVSYRNKKAGCEQQPVFYFLFFTAMRGNRIQQGRFQTGYFQS